MTDKTKYTPTVVRVVPFTGLLFAIWAFFSPDGYGHWLGSIVKAFRVASGI